MAQKANILSSIKKDVQQLKNKSGAKAAGDVTSLRVKLSSSAKEKSKLQTKISDLEAENEKLKRRLGTRASSTTRSGRSKIKHRSASTATLSSTAKLKRMKSRDKLTPRSSARKGSTGSTGSTGSLTKALTPRSRPKTPSSKTPRSSSKKLRASSKNRKLTSSSSKSKSKSKRSDSRLSEATQDLQLVRDELKRCEISRNELDAENTVLKGELVALAQQLQHAMSSTNNDMLSKIDELQKSILDYQAKNEELKRQLRQRQNTPVKSDGLQARVSELEQFLIALKRENDKLSAVNKTADPATVKAELDKKDQEIAKLRLRYEQLNTKYQEAVNSKKQKQSRMKTVALSNQVTDLSYQVFYGATSKDEEIEQLRKQLAELDPDAEGGPANLQTKFRKVQRKRVEEWLFSTDADEVL